ncbi:E3 ubiquitin protein ligase COP1-like protein isoform X1 [Tanacetum coccineum]
MDDVSTGAIVPAPSEGSGQEVVDKEVLCPICMGIIKDAFMTSCGHSYCYMCIITHLDHKSDCPCCGAGVTVNQIFPNFLLDKGVLDKSSISTKRSRER